MFAISITMSYTIAVTGNESVLATYLNPPLRLDSKGYYEIALLNFETFYSIPNVDQSNNKFHYISNEELKVIDIPHGTYEIADINEYIKDKLELDESVFFIRPNNNTMKAEIKCPFAVDFSKECSVGSLLGFDESTIIPANQLSDSDFLVNIFKVSIIRIECSIATGSFIDGKSGHSIYEFFPSVPPGYHISQEPSNPIYLPIVDTNFIDQITLRIVDQNDQLINFRNEDISIRLHIRRNGNRL